MLKRQGVGDARLEMIDLYENRMVNTKQTNEFFRVKVNGKYLFD